MVVNGSPRAPKSNSKRYAALFSKYSKNGTSYFNISKTNHLALCGEMEAFSHLLFVFPLYADGIPVTLLHFLKTLEQNPPKNKPTVSVLINCGFLESRQNDVAVDMMRLFCKENGYPFGSVLKIGSGEAILDTPFRVLVARKIRKLAKGIEKKEYQVLKVSMPLSRKMFLRASTVYWTNYGKKNNVTKEQMETMQIEGPGEDEKKTKPF